MESKDKGAVKHMSYKDRKTLTDTKENPHMTVLALITYFMSPVSGLVTFLTPVIKRRRLRDKRRADGRRKRLTC